MSEYVRLILNFPPSLESSVTEVLSDDPSLPGFTLLHAEGHSSNFAHASASEQVRGRIERRVLWIVIANDRLQEVLDLLRQHVASHDVRWWTEPVSAFGRLA